MPTYTGFEAAVESLISDKPGPPPTYARLVTLNVPVFDTSLGKLISWRADFATKVEASVTLRNVTAPVMVSTPRLRAGFGIVAPFGGGSTHVDRTGRWSVFEKGDEETLFLAPSWSMSTEHAEAARPIPKGDAGETFEVKFATWAQPAGLPVSPTAFSDWDFEFHSGQVTVAAFARYEYE